MSKPESLRRMEWRSAASQASFVLPTAPNGALNATGLLSSAQPVPGETDCFPCHAFALSGEPAILPSKCGSLELKGRRLGMTASP